MRTRTFHQKRLPWIYHGLVAVLKTVQELCRSFNGVTAVTAESYGCVWHLQQRYAGHDVLEVSLEWTYGAITFLSGR